MNLRSLKSEAVAPLFLMASAVADNSCTCMCSELKIWGTMELRVGNKYRLGRKIGSGSFGDIYLGEYLKLWSSGNFTDKDFSTL